MNPISSIIGDYDKFLDDVYKNLKKSKIDVSNFPIDHIAYRATTKESYEAVRDRLPNFGEMISEFSIRNRPIAVIELNEELNHNGTRIRYIEVAAPAEGDTFKEGLEHAEFVIDTNILEFTKRYPSMKFIVNKNEINPELILKFPNNANAKFHELPINEVIKLQKSSR